MLWPAMSSPGPRLTSLGRPPGTRRKRETLHVAFSGRARRQIVCERRQKRRAPVRRGTPLAVTASLVEVDGSLVFVIQSVTKRDSIRQRKTDHSNAAVTHHEL